MIKFADVQANDTSSVQSMLNLMFFVLTFHCTENIRGERKLSSLSIKCDGTPMEDKCENEINGNCFWFLYLNKILNRIGDIESMVFVVGIRNTKEVWN